MKYAPAKIKSPPTKKEKSPPAKKVKSPPAQKVKLPAAKVVTASKVLKRKTPVQLERLGEPALFTPGVQPSEEPAAKRTKSLQGHIYRTLCAYKFSGLQDNETVQTTMNKILKEYLYKDKM